MTPRAASRVFVGKYSEKAVIEVAESIRHEIGTNASLGVLFLTQEWRPHLEDTLELIANVCGQKAAAPANHLRERVACWLIETHKLTGIALKQFPYQRATAESADLYPHVLVCPYQLFKS